MRKLILQTLLLLSLVLGTVFFLFSRVDGYMDNYYMRFTTPKASSMILGTSRSAQGLMPSVFNEILGREDFFNYSFTIATSPYGPVYLNSIEKKIDTQSKKGVFILTVDPWSISSVIKNPNDVDKFKEKNGMLFNQHFVNNKPNFEYLIKHYHKRFFDPRHVQRNAFLHDDGWLEITIPMDSAVIAERTQRKLESYRTENLPKFKYSEERIYSLGMIIDLLNEHGDVFLVRLPISSGMYEIEQELMPDFNKKITKLSSDKSIPYNDLTVFNDQYVYTDGNHISTESGKEVSKYLANWISKLKTQQ